MNITQTFRYLVQLQFDSDYGTFKEFDNAHAAVEWMRAQFSEGAAIGPGTVYMIGNDDNKSTLYGIYRPYDTI